MIPERDALAVLWRHKRTWLALSATGAVLLALSVAWSWIPDTRTAGVVLSFLSIPALAFGWARWIAATFAFYRRIHSAQTWRLPLRFFPSAGALIAAAVYRPRLLISWRPLLEGLTVETISLTLRFSLAYLVAITAWLLLASLAARLQAESPAPPS